MWLLDGKGLASDLENRKRMGCVAQGACGLECFLLFSPDASGDMQMYLNNIGQDTEKSLPKSIGNNIKVDKIASLTRSTIQVQIAALED